MIFDMFPERYMYIFTLLQVYNWLDNIVSIGSMRIFFSQIFLFLFLLPTFVAVKLVTVIQKAYDPTCSLLGFSLSLSLSLCGCTCA
ncbi:hypothetical protein J3Q64DRAFT_1769855 [Phycomyces blakesleeanus]|uniref:Ion transport domain-containing protein n=1 Tax=Phycomyces blakesleeanus TaxID=4837 RepID=A0ABR3ALS3_PHYBL